MMANNFMVFKFKFYDLLIRLYCLCADQLSNIQHFGDSGFAGCNHQKSSNGAVHPVDYRQ